jgi:hypothetical protein
MTVRELLGKTSSLELAYWSEYLKIVNTQPEE